MAIDFPNSPTNGDTYTDADTTWEYSSADNTWTVLREGVSGYNPGSILTAAIGDDQVTGAKIADDTITPEKLNSVYYNVEASADTITSLDTISGLSVSSVPVGMWLVFATFTAEVVTGNGLDARLYSDSNIICRNYIDSADVKQTVALIGTSYITSGTDNITVQAASDTGTSVITAGGRLIVVKIGKT